MGYPDSDLTDATHFAQPIYDLCDHCRLPIRPGEEHGVLEVAQSPDQTPGVICRIRTLMATTTVIPSQKGER